MGADTSTSEVVQEIACPCNSIYSVESDNRGTYLVAIVKMADLEKLVVLLSF